MIVKGFDVNDPKSYPLMIASLNEYANTLQFWAQNAAGRIITDVALRDENLAHLCKGFITWCT